MPSGRWAPPTSSGWPPASWSVGCAPPTSAPARSWGPRFSPLVWNQVGAAATQATLRRWFARWGLPGGLRLDNGNPWGGWNDLPAALALWLAGLGLGLTFNPPRQPRFNGVVEKSHDTGDRWCEPHTCGTPGQLQARFDEMDRIQREEYPVRRGLSRVQLWPGLGRPRRAYTAAWEQAHWSLALAEEYLAGHVAVRRVGAGGRLWRYNRRVQVGRQHAGEAAYVVYDPEGHDWVVASRQGTYWARVPAPEVSRERIVGLSLCER